jgi:hypothetical protein
MEDIMKNNPYPTNASKDLKVVRASKPCKRLTEIKVLSLWAVSGAVSFVG